VADPPHAEPVLQAFVAERDTPCPGCGYSLRGLKTSRCPECNEELVLELRLAEPRLTSWLLTIAGPFAGMVGGAGVLIVVTIIALRVGGLGSMRTPETWVFLYIPLFALGSGAMLVWRLMLRPTRRWFRGLGGAARAWVVVGCWILPLGCFGVMLGLVLTRF